FLFFNKGKKHTTIAFPNSNCGPSLYQSQPLCQNHFITGEEVFRLLGLVSRLYFDDLPVLMVDRIVVAYDLLPD
ncbi:MAG TPA: hypothetical protein VE170_17405, partial [Candidatus Limnocylindria bacterium]|nr:hypothetical protein [Candidatus Limnocylindria bacterium]